MWLGNGEGNEMGKRENRGDLNSSHVRVKMALGRAGGGVGG
jgi:hypothetical protein